MENISLSLQIQQPTQQTNPPPPPPPRQQTHMAVLHSVRKPPAKLWKRPLLPPPRVYHCEPLGFRKLVQKLTGAPPKKVVRPLRDTLLPPPPLDLPPRPLLPPPHPSFHYGYSTVQAKPSNKPATPPMSSDDNGFIGMLSPSLCSPYARWCSFPLLSPGTMASLELSNSPIL